MSNPMAHGPGSDRYHPDPGTETAMAIDALVDEADLAGRLRRRHQDLVADQQERVVDQVTRYNLSLTLAVLAAHQEVSGRPDEDLVPALTQPFVEPMEPCVCSATRASLDQATDPFVTKVELTQDRGRHAFGAAFHFDHPDNDQGRYTAQVTRCYYHEILSANGAGQLTPVLCAFAADWSDAIDPERDGFGFDRPATIGSGGGSCPFRFYRTRPAS